MPRGFEDCQTSNSCPHWRTLDRSRRDSAPEVAAIATTAGKFLGDQETSCSASHGHIAANADRYTIVDWACAVVAADCSPDSLDLD